MDIKIIQKKLQKFSKERDWDKFHTPKNLSMALSVEVAELVEIFQWLENEDSKVNKLNDMTKKSIEEELGDIMIYVIRLADKLNIGLENSVNNKIKINSKKYPVELSKGNAVKYNKR